MVVKPTEWKRMAIIARNAKFKRRQGQIFAWFGSKMAKNDYCQ